MADSTTILGDRVPGSFPHALADAARKMAGMFPAGSMVGTNRARLISQLADYIQGLPLDDPRLNAVFTCWTSSNQSARTYAFDLGGRERALALSRLATDGASPQPGPLLDELAYLAAKDALSSLRHDKGRAANQAQEHRARADELEARIRQMNDDEATVAQQATTITVLREQIKERDRQIALFRALAQGEEPADEPEQEAAAEKPARRKAVEGHTGIYRIQNGDYEVSYYEGKGAGKRRRWKITGSKIEDAIAFQQEKRGDPEAPSGGSASSFADVMTGLHRAA